jgi:hypothetical protein
MDRGFLPIRQVGSWPRRVGVGGLVGGFFIVVVFAPLRFFAGRVVALGGLFRCVAILCVVVCCATKKKVCLSVCLSVCPVCHHDIIIIIITIIIYSVVYAIYIYIYWFGRGGLEQF